MGGGRRRLRCWSPLPLGATRFVRQSLGALRPMALLSELDQLLYQDVARCPRRASLSSELVSPDLPSAYSGLTRTTHGMVRCACR